MIKLVHYDDGKGKWRSHEIYLKEDTFYDDEYEVFSTNPFDAMGYGATKEEALNDFMRKIDYVLREWDAVEKLLFSTNVLTDNIKEVDCFGEYIK